MDVFDFTNFDWSKVDKTTAQQTPNNPIQFKPPSGPSWEAVSKAAEQSPATRKLLAEPPSCKIIGAGGITFGRAGLAKPSIYTRAMGVTAGLVDGLIGGVGGVGVWGSNLPQRGWYLSGGIQAQTNVGGSIGGEYTHIWGPPSDLNGPSINVGLDVGPNVVTGSARLIIAIKSNPFRFDLVGMSFALSVGFSVLPANITVELTGTKIFVR